VNHSLRGVDVETPTSEWRKRPRSALAGMARRTDDGFLARRDRTSPIDPLAARYPVIRRLVGAPSTIWENNRIDDGDGMIERWIAEAAIVARPFLKVEGRRLPSGGYAFLSALSEGKTVATAVESATEASPRFDVVSCLMLLDDASMVVGIQEAA
jgi:hypothetical protein